MNTKHLLKTVFLIAVLLLLVIMGMNNLQNVDRKMSPILSKPQTLPAAIMYFAFFAVGVLSGTVISAGSRGAGRSSKGDN